MYVRMYVGMKYSITTYSFIGSIGGTALLHGKMEPLLGNTKLTQSKPTPHNLHQHTVAKTAEWADWLGGLLRNRKVLGALVEVPSRCTHIWVKQRPCSKGDAGVVNSVIIHQCTNDHEHQIELLQGDGTDLSSGTERCCFIRQDPSLGVAAHMCMQRAMALNTNHFCTAVAMVRKYAGMHFCKIAVHL